ncbi:MAG TPA: MarR family transcriptional regulator [Dermatophilaceae bacterium]|jgi:DNA-binding MarR family transcriptional regulator
MAERNPDGYSRVERELAVLLRRARAGSGDLSRDAPPDLQATAYALLTRLHDLGSARAADLSDYFGIDKGALSRQLRLLQDLQLIARETDTADRRSQRLSLTARGRQRLTQARRARRRLIRQELPNWPACDVEAFGDLLARFNSAAPDGS